MAQVIEETDKIPDVDDTFDDPKEEPKEELKEETPETVETGVTEETETAKAEEGTEEAEAPAADSEKAGLLATIKAERGRRQEAERKLQEREVKAPDPAIDPEGYDEFNAARSKQLALDAKIELSQDLMRDSHEDYDAMESTFMSLISEDDGEGNLVITDPKLHKQFLSSANPAKFAYQQAQKHLQFEEVTSGDYEKSLRERIKKELLEDLDSGAPELPDLTNAAASASNTEQELKDKDPYEDDVFD